MSLIESLPKKPESTEAIVDISTMSNTELLRHILELYRLNYELMDVKNRSKYSSCRNFYQGVGRGFWECQRTVNELIGRLENNDNVQSN